MDRMRPCEGCDGSSTLPEDAEQFEDKIFCVNARKGAGAVKRPGLENLGGRKAHASSNLALSARRIFVTVSPSSHPVFLCE